MPYLYQRIFYVSPRQNDIYVQPISTNFTYVSLSCMSFLYPTNINKFHTCQKLGNRSYVIPISTDFLCVLYLCTSYINKFHTCLIIMYVIPISMNILCASSLELFLCHTYINKFSMCLLFRMISMSNLYQRISYISQYHVCILIIIIFMYNLYQQILYVCH